MLPFRNHCARIPFVVGVFLVGCQHMAPEPLELQEHLAVWENREIDVEPVAELVMALGQHLDEAAIFDPDDGLSLVEAEAIALWHHPGLAGARLEIDRAAALAAVGGSMPDPGLQLEGGRKREEMAGSFLSPSTIERSWLAGASLAITIPLSGRLGAERRMAGTAYDVAVLRVAEMEWEHLHTLHEAWLYWSALHWKRDTLEAHRDAVDAFARAAQGLAEVGELDPMTARLFAISRGRMAGRLAQVQEELEGRRIEIFGLMGLKPEAPLFLNPALSLHPPIAVPESWREEITATHPQLRRMAAEYALAEAKLARALKEQYPDIVLTPGLLEERNETALLLGLGMPLPLWNRNRSGIAEAYWEREQLRALIHSEQEAILNAFAMARAQWAGAKALRSTMEQEIAPLIDTQLAESRALLEMGEVDLMLMENVLTQAIEIKLELVEAHLQEQLARAKKQHFLETHAVHGPGEGVTEP